MYLHHVFDLWVEVWRKKVAAGDVIVVRYADDLVAGFEHRADAERFLKDFRERLAKFGPGLHTLLREAPEQWDLHRLAGNGEEADGGQAACH